MMVSAASQFLSRAEEAACESPYELLDCRELRMMRGAASDALSHLNFSDSCVGCQAGGFDMAQSLHARSDYGAQCTLKYLMVCVAPNPAPTVLSCVLPCPLTLGITLSPKQVARGTQLARERGLNNVTFKVRHMLAALD
jgi:hypothetical protein